ncbi:MAG: aldo/keto reductase, partial [Bacillota bacterium]
MEYQLLGHTGLKVSRLCFGSLTMGPLQANLSIKQGAALLRYAFELGVNFIDTAKLYRTYPYIKEALRGWDAPVIIASKSYDYTWEGMQRSVEEARLAIDRDYLDIFLLHEQESELTLEGHRPALEYLWEAKAKG